MDRKLIISSGLALLASLFALLHPAIAQDGEASSGFDAFDFLEGHWRGTNNGLTFEEIWSGAEGGVMTAMMRGARDGKLVVLEYIIIAESDQGPVLRFKHFNADYSNWEGEEDAPITLYLTRALEDDVLFTTTDDQATVQRIRYFLSEEDTLQADVGLLREGVAETFSLMFNRVKSSD